jgi:Holliday junction resolvase RusA-like endonuclease
VSALLVFTVGGPPVPWQRTQTRGGQRFTPKRQRAYQSLVALHASMAITRKVWPSASTFAVELDVYQQDARRRDLDNFAKTVGDACNGVLWDDDSQIVEWRLRKHIDRAQPRIEVRVRVAPDRALEADDIMHGSERRPPIKWVDE